MRCLICPGDKSARVNRWGGVPVRLGTAAEAVAIVRTSVLAGRIVERYSIVVVCFVGG